MKVQLKGGLANRLRTMAAFLEIADRITGTVAFYWPVDAECNGRWSDVFKPRADVSDVPLKGAVDYAGQGTIKEIMREHGYANPDVFAIVENQYKKFLVRDDLMAEAKQFAGQIGGPYAAVHIRRTDHTALAKKAGAYTTLGEFETFASMFPAVYLATDCAEIQRKYPNWLRYRNIRPRADLRQTDLRHTMIDVLVCAGAEHFKGSGYSSYSTLIHRMKKVIKIMDI